jgi:molybdopterin-containing oxidoreductase family iron-sulfur binding subunit
MVIDLDRCTACGACMAACKVENNVPIVPVEEARRGRRIHWLRLLAEPSGSYPDLRVRIAPNLCMMCDNPPCTKVCPVHATYVGTDRLVGQIYPRCIGCRYCMAACPYSVKAFNWRRTDPPEGMAGILNPDVSVRPKGVVEKCTFCYHRLQAARENARAANRPVRESDYQPACVQSCPADAMVFGDLDDGMSPVAQLSRSRRAVRALEHLGTEPKIYFLERRDAQV